MSANLGLVPATGNIWPSAAANDIALYTTGQVTAWFGASNSSCISVSSNAGTVISGNTTLSNLIITGTVTGFTGASSNQTFSNVVAATATASNLFSSNATISNLNVVGTVANFNNINFTGSLLQNGTAYINNSGTVNSAVANITGSNATYSNLTVTNSLTLGSNTIGFSTGALNQITAQTWQYMQNYVYSGVPNAVPVTSTLMTGVASLHSAYIQGGNVYTFGLNTNGQLGLGIYSSNARIPTQVPLLSNATQVSCGANYTLVLLSDGTAYAMGGNLYGQLGNGNTIDQYSPVKVQGVSNITAITAGYFHSLFLLSNGSVLGYGTNANGQLGNVSGQVVNTSPVTTSVPYPTGPVGSNVRLIDAGANHSAFLLNNGTLWTCGQNNLGQLGQGTASSTNIMTPQIVAGPYNSNICNMACGQFHNIMVNAAGAIFSFGNNSSGQCGTGTTAITQYNTPTPAVVLTAPAGTSNAGFSNFLAAGLAHSVVVNHIGATYTFGDNTYGQLGVNASTLASTSTPTLLLMSYAVYTAYSVACGANTTLLLLNNSVMVPQQNRIVAFGQNQYGQVGNAMFSPTGIAASSNVYTPVPLTNNTTIYRKQLFNSGQGNMTAYVDSDGTLYTWGLNNYSQLGDNTTINRTVPTPNSSLNFTDGTTRIMSVACGSGHTMALDSTGQVWAWGNNGNYQIGNNTTTTQTIPLNLTSSSTLSSRTIVAVACGGSYYTAALDSTGQVWTWGRNSEYQIGNNTNTTQFVPLNISAMTTPLSPLASKTIVAIACGEAHTAALDSTGQVWTWGRNDVFQIGNNINTANQFVPLNISAMTSPLSPLASKTIVAIACGSLHTAALDSTGQVWTWGYNWYNQIGNNTINTTSQFVPFNISAMTNPPSPLASKTIVAITCGGNHSMALDSVGQVWTWGYNAQYQIGNNTAADQRVPLNISAMTTPLSPLANKTIVAIACGGNYSMALDSTGQIWTWGQNTQNQIGNNTNTVQRVPLQITWNNRQNTPMYSIGGLGDHKLLMARTANLAVLQAVGANQYGQIGDSTTTTRSQIVTLPTFPANITSCATGMFHSACVLSTGVPYLWGLNNAGQIGQLNTTATSLTPTAFNQITNASSVACGSNTTFFLLNNNTVAAIGDNTFNGLGVPSTTVATSTGAATNTAVIVPGLSNIVKVVAGTQAGMALDSTGKLYSWGNNSNGVTSQGTFANTTAIPTLVNPTYFNSLPVTNVTMGDGIAAAIAGGNLYTVGINTEGALGIASNFGTGAINTFTQVPISSTNTVVNVAQGARHTVVQLANNTILTFGENDAGQLGTGMAINSGASSLVAAAIPTSYTTSNTYIPRVPLLYPSQQATSISASANATMVEHYDQTTQEYGAQIARQTKLMTGCVQNHSCIVTPSGSLFLWGYNNVYQIGNSSLANQTTPLNLTAISTLSSRTIVAVACGGANTMALDSSGAVWAWGNNGSYQIGNGTNANQRVPLNITPISNLSSRTIVAIACGDSHSMALDSTGTVWMWGYGGNYQIGDGTTGNKSTPFNLTSISTLSSKTIVAIACGGSHTMALDSTGSVWTWGANGNNQLGLGSATTISSLYIIPITAFSSRTILAIACGSGHTAALDSTGTVWLWGFNWYGQIGDGNSSTTRSSPFNIPITAFSSRTIVAIACGNNHSMALDSTGQVWTWGANGSYQIGNGNNTTQTTPYNIPITAFSSRTIVAIACGSDHSMALDSTGAIWMWGSSSVYQLGNLVGGTQSTPLNITGKGDLTTLSITAPVITTAFTPFFVNFTGQHRVFIAGASTNELNVSEGFIVVCDRNDYITQGPNNTNPFGEFVRGQNAVTINDALPVVSLAKKAYDKRVFGVLSPSKYALSPDDDPPNSTTQQRLVESGDVRMQVNALGDGAIWVSDINGPLTSGDFITSSEIPGYGQLQSTDDMVHNYTVAKITRDCDFTAPLQPVYAVQKDANGQNVLDPITGQPVWIPQTYEELRDPQENNAIAITPTDIQKQNMTPEQIAALVTVTLPLMEPAYKMRWLLADGSQISQETYNIMMANKEPAYRAAFVGCTYHSG